MAAGAVWLLRAPAAAPVPPSATVAVTLPAPAAPQPEAVIAPLPSEAPPTTVRTARVDAPRARPVPSPAAPTTTPRPATPARPPARAFKQGLTNVDGPEAKVKGGGLTGFSQDPDVAVRKAPEAAARVELVVAPERVAAGERFHVDVFLRNDGNKPIALERVALSLTVDGRTSALPSVLRAREVAFRQRTLIAAYDGTFPAGSSIALTISATTRKNETIASTGSWR